MAEQTETQTLSLSREQVERLIAFCNANGLEKWFIAKDQGAYIGATMGAKPEQKVIYYFEGCDPEKDEDWYENARNAFGGDDWGQHLPVRDLEGAVAIPEVTGVDVVVTPKFINIDRRY